MLAQGWLLANSGAARALANTELSGWPPAMMICVWFLPTIIFLAALEFSFTNWSVCGALMVTNRRRTLEALVHAGAIRGTRQCDNLPGTCVVPATRTRHIQYSLPDCPNCGGLF